MIVAAALLLLAGEENRLWFLELELRGACESVRLDCGRDGDTVLQGPFPQGEDRRLVLPVPVRSPLGLEGLAALPFPRVDVQPPGATGAARVLGWSQTQPVEGLRGTGLSPPLIRPPGRAARTRPGASELCVVLVAGGFLLRFRRRLVVCLIVSVTSGALAFGWVWGRPSEPVASEILQWRVGRPSALRMLRSDAGVALACAALEVSPEGAPIHIEWASRGVGLAFADQASLFALSLTPPPAVAASRNEAELLEETWTRPASGGWRAHGGWDVGEPLGPGGAGVPPGWVAGTPAPGSGVLVARARDGVWLRALGFEVE